MQPEKVIDALTVIQIQLNKLLGEAEQYLTIDEAAAFMKLKRSYFYKPGYKEMIGFIKKGNVLRFKKSDLVKFLESGHVKPVSSVYRNNKVLAEQIRPAETKFINDEHNNS